MNAVCLILTFLFIALSPTYSLANHHKVTLAEVTNQLQQTFILDNGIRVLAISDPNANVASASVSIQSGQGDTTHKTAGLPHLVEHAVFKGSKQFPKVRSWDAFFRQGKNWSNGSTRPDITRYHFQVESPQIKEGLIRLSDMLFRPLLTDQALATSLKEVEAEFHQKNGTWRKILSVMRATRNQQHPLAIFGTGNKQSLADKDIFKKARSFHRDNYCTDNIALVVYSNQPISDLKKNIDLSFGGVSKRTGCDNRTKKKEEPLFNTDQTGMLVKLAGDSSSASLDLLFEIPARVSRENELLPLYFAELLSSEFPQYLKQVRTTELPLVEQPSLAFQGDMYTGIADIYIPLTEQGDASAKLVIQHLFHFISKLYQQPPSAELQQKLFTRISSKHKEDRKEVGDWLSDISDQMIRYNSASYNPIFKTPVVFSHQQIRAFLAKFNRHNMQAFHYTALAQPTHYSPYYEMPYEKMRLGED